MKTEIHLHLFSLENFVFVIARTDAQYFSSSFFYSPARPLENSILFCRLGPLEKSSLFCRNANCMPKTTKAIKKEEKEKK